MYESTMLKLDFSFSHTCQFKHVFAYGSGAAFGQDIILIFFPLDIWHRTTHSHTSYVQVRARHYLVIRIWGNGEAGSHSPHCKMKIRVEFVVEFQNLYFCGLIKNEQILCFIKRDPPSVSFRILLMSPIMKCGEWLPTSPFLQILIAR